MRELTAAERRYQKNATLIAALHLAFETLRHSGVPLSRVDQVAHTASGGTPSRSVSSYFGGPIPWIKSGELPDGPITECQESLTHEGLADSAAKVLPAGTLVIALYGATVGKLGFLTFDAASNQAVCAVTPKSNEVLTEYLFWFLRHKRQDFLAASFGGAQPNISQKLLRQTICPVPTVSIQRALCRFFQAVEERQKGDRKLALPELPCPLSEQRRIVVKIDRLAEKIEEARGLRNTVALEANALWESTLADTMADLRARFREDTFGKICEVVRGGSPRPAGSLVYYDGPIPFLKVGDITNDSSKYVSSYTTTIKEAGLHRSRMVQPGTLMLTNSGATLGVPKICTIQTCFNDGIQAFLGLPHDLNKEFLYYFLASKTKWFREKAARGQGQPNLNTAMVKELAFPCPPPSKQRRIVAYLDDLQAKIDAIKKLQEQTAAELDALLPSILDKAFKGDL